MRQKLHRQWKKVLAVVLSVAMILGVCPLASEAQAANPTPVALTLTGAMFGAFGGFSVCAIGDLIGCFFSGYPPNPLILIATGFLGLIPGIVMTYIKSNFYFKVILSFIICSLVCTAGLNTLGIYLYYSSRSVPFFAYMIARFPLQLPVMAVNCVLAIVLSKIINKTSFPFKIN